ncbi:MAG: DNA integrity scanning protein DisA nucleotide-binding domain protein [Desulfobulbaceae bacterium]|nr:DNA integrity scanning protein DisA nucleotide-binding domain protein [Desulfobulbaceae bacterium]
MRSWSSSFVRRCVSNILGGLCDGLTHFSGTSRAALLLTLDRDSPMLVCDPQGLLKGHEPIFKSLYLDNQDWRRIDRLPDERDNFAEIIPAKDPGLAGLISCGGYSGSVFFQQWFTEHHPDICSIGPTSYWLEYAVWLLSHDLANNSDLYSNISGNFLKEYALHAVRDYIIDQMNRLLGWDTQLRIYPVLDALLIISETHEEGSWPLGRLLFVDPNMVDQLDFLVRYQENMRPRLIHYKHVRKLLLTVEHSDCYLVSNGQSILGICTEKNLPIFSLCADYQGRHGFLRVNGEAICSFSEGRFTSSSYRTKLVQLEELLLEYPLARDDAYSLYQMVIALVCHAQERNHGSTIILDMNPQPMRISGQPLKPPLDLRQPYLLNLAKSLAKVDGALQIGADLHLHGFASLLDGKSFPGEELARGARYNSALRFTAENDKVIAIVVSSDRPVSVMRQGIDFRAATPWGQRQGSVYPLETLEEWVKH